MRFVPYERLETGSPNIIVDGAAGPGTVLTLSHWPKSGTPASLKRDTSAEIAFAYLDSPSAYVAADIASNNHFDEDGPSAFSRYWIPPRPHSIANSC